MRQPTLSVVMSNYNHARFLPEALLAILRQSYQPAEIIIIDDASTDQSGKVLAEFGRRYSLLKIIQNERNLGLLHNGNRLLNFSTGDYVYWASADDKILPGFFQKSMDLLRRYPQAGLCSALYLHMDEAGKYQRLCKLPIISTTACFLNPKQFRQAFGNYGSWLQGVTVIYQRQALLDAGGFPPELGSFADGFMCEVLALRHGVCFIPEPLAAMRRMATAYSRTTGANLERALEIKKQADILMDYTYGDLFPPDCKKSVHRHLIHWSGWEVWNEVHRQQERFLSESFTQLRPVPGWIDRLFLMVMRLFVQGQNFVVKCFFVGLVRQSPLVWLKFWVNYLRVWRRFRGKWASADTDKGSPQSS